MEIRRGRLFAIEGGDSSGKKTQSDRLYKKLLIEGYQVELLDFPQYGRNIFADTTASYLEGEFGNPTEVNPYLAALPFAADRLLRAPHIRRGLDNGIIYVSNRFTFSSGGHQGAKIKDSRERYNFMEWLRRVEFGQEGFNIPPPDLTILLDVEPSTSEKLGAVRTTTTGKEPDGHETDKSYRTRVIETFREIATRDPTWRTIDCMTGDKSKILGTDEIEKKIWEIVQPYLPPQKFG